MAASVAPPTNGSTSFLGVTSYYANAHKAKLSAVFTYALHMPVAALLVMSGGDGKPRRQSDSLQMLSDWCQPSISDAELEKAQLPVVVQVPDKKIIRKPSHW
jgi:hypothetical protein